MRRGGRIGLIAALLLAACTPHGPPLGGPRLGGPRLGGLAPAGTIAAEIPAGGVPLAPEHTLSAGDEFEIRLPFAADYNDRVTVGMDGTVAPKSIGKVQVGGLSVPEATGRLRERYAKLLKAPELSVTMRRYTPEIVYVDGWVARPGLIRSDVPLTVARALARAGGIKTGARNSGILILRHDAGGAVHPYEVGLGSYAGAGAEDPLLKSFDVVYVPQSPITAVVDFARQYYSNVPFSASFHIPPTTAPTLVTPRGVVAPPVPAPGAPAPVTPP